MLFHFRSKNTAYSAYAAFFFRLILFSYCRYYATPLRFTPARYADMLLLHYDTTVRTVKRHYVVSLDDAMPLFFYVTRAYRDFRCAAAATLPLVLLQVYMALPLIIFAARYCHASSSPLRYICFHAAAMPLLCYYADI